MSSLAEQRDALIASLTATDRKIIEMRAEILALEARQVRRHADLIRINRTLAKRAATPE